MVVWGEWRLGGQGCVCITYYYPSFPGRSSALNPNPQSADVFESRTTPKRIHSQIFAHTHHTHHGQQQQVLLYAPYTAASAA